MRDDAAADQRYRLLCDRLSAHFEVRRSAQPTAQPLSALREFVTARFRDAVYDLSSGCMYLSGVLTTLTPAGPAASLCTVTRLQTDGSWDASFVIGLFGAAGTACAAPQLLQTPDGRLYVAGAFHSAYDADGPLAQPSLLRIAAGGRIDRYWRPSLSAAAVCLAALSAHHGCRLVVGLAEPPFLLLCDPADPQHVMPVAGVEARVTQLRPVGNGLLVGSRSAAGALRLQRFRFDPQQATLTPDLRRPPPLDGIFRPEH
jgi:hypothetical protein